MGQQRRIHTPWRVVLPVSLGTGLSLMGDSALYAVLPLSLGEAGIALTSVGVLLSVNRIIRLLLNAPAGMIYDRAPRRWLFLPALFLGAASTAVYALTRGFWPLFFGRLLWGLAWTGIWVGGNTIILDIARDEDRGRWVGLYQSGFFLGAAAGALAGGLMTDAFGFHRAMGINATVTLAGAIFALLLLPETRPRRPVAAPVLTPTRQEPGRDPLPRRMELLAANVLFGVNRLVVAGVIPATFGLYLNQHLGDPVQMFGQSLGVTSLTGVGLSAATLTSMGVVPLLGRLSDRSPSRWQVVAGGLVPGVAGFGLMALGSPLTIFSGLLLIAVTSGSNTGLATTLVGDMATRVRQGRHLGVLYTVGDLGSAIGPPLAYALIPFMGLEGVYLLMGALLVATLGMAIQRVVRAPAVLNRRAK